MTRGMDHFVASAPARANIIGEHTDYPSNAGHVLPTPLPLFTTARVETMRGDPSDVVVSSTRFNEPLYTRSLVGGRMEHWSDYVVGCLRAASAETRLPALKVEVQSGIPMGCGIASSAALCVAVLRAVKGLIGTNWIDEEIALMAYHAEHDYVGVPCGTMDQFASALGRPGQAMLLDTKTLRSRNYRLDPRMSLMVVDFGSRRHLAKGAYLKYRLQRQAECREARDLWAFARCASLAIEIFPDCRCFQTTSRGVLGTLLRKTCGSWSLSKRLSRVISNVRAICWKRAISRSVTISSVPTPRWTCW